ncbi:VWA domain-containing protein [Solimonas sp. K1W22B-7]|uniref:TerY-C metal binding domain-containing protein n=1 Tax=Solimonas sp. K1W22B-7 TaxID=2303331 RepID=UPI000E32EC59|nr:TerY-C metal binding domain-containing protein [Solimonas sp. K1W22B-7]AXQ27499.1 VWA domain-containing protein [Solimonas sp. K1W22B-7]
MRRLPIYFLLDVSESMAGEALYRLEDGMGAVIKTLRTDPHALETVWISVIAFAGQVRQLAPLTEVASFVPPSLPVGGGTSLGKALSFLMDEIDRSVVRSTPDRKGDWKPIVFLITDGKPTDDVAKAVERWRTRYAGSVSLVAISIGHSADLSVLSQLTDAGNVLTLEENTDANFAKFIQWVTQSVQARSRSVGDISKEEKLPELDKSILTRLNLDKPLDRVDDSNAFFVSKCQKTQLPYLVRFEPRTARINAGQTSFDSLMYVLVGCYPVKNSYFEMSADQPNVATVDSNQLHGFPSCPHCGNPVGFAMCDCGNTFCISGPGEQTCPWCRQTAQFSRGKEGDPGVDLTRARG